MQILLACAKIMNDSTPVATPFVTRPHFADDAGRFAAELSGWTVEELAAALHCSETLAKETKKRYLQFFDEGRQLPAVLGYYGQAYKCLQAGSFDEAMFRFAQDHLWIASFLYGLLRPLDSIHPYRLEGKVTLEQAGGLNMFGYWKNRLTGLLIGRVKADDGVLVHLATEEMEHLFDWKRVRREVRIVQPQFFVIKNGKLKNVTVYSKSCRGAMTRFIIAGGLQSPEALKAFEYEGFAFTEAFGDEEHPHFIV